MAIQRRRIKRRKVRFDISLSEKSIEDINGNCEQGEVEIVSRDNSVAKFKDNEDQDVTTAEEYKALEKPVDELMIAISNALWSDERELIGVFGINNYVVIRNCVAFFSRSRDIHYLGTSYYSKNTFRDVYESICATIRNELRNDIPYGQFNLLNSYRNKAIYIANLKYNYRNSKRGKVFNRVFEELKSIYNMRENEKFLIVIDVADDSLDYILLSYLSKIVSPHIIIVVTYRFDIDIAASMISRSIGQNNAGYDILYNCFYSGNTIRCN